jgi:AraC-like DNA-binding protein
MTGAIFFDVECGAPWGFAVPAIDTVAHQLAPGTERLVNYHLVTRGQARVCFEDGEEVAVTAGDVVVLPHGEAHTVCHGSPTTIVESRVPVEEILAGQPRTLRLGGDGESTKIICGFFGCERHADRLFLAGLPRVFKVNLRTDDAGSWLENSVEHLVGQARSERPGTAVLLSKMADALFVETLRRYMETLPPEQVGWLAGARDPVVGGALALLHREPERAWTIAELGSAVGASRSVLAERFTRLLGAPPLTYLAHWRMQLAARYLETTRDSVTEIATKVGYQSEAAFNRAFKREFGLPPVKYRRSRASDD